VKACGHEHFTRALGLNTTSACVYAGAYHGSSHVQGWPAGSGVFFYFCAECLYVFAGASPVGPEGQPNGVYGAGAPAGCVVKGLL